MKTIEEIRSDFPILKQLVNNNPLIYLDNAATTQKPKKVLDTIVDYYTRYNANIHRGVHYLSQIATEQYEQARIKVQKLINAEKKHEIIFTSGTTHAINLVANGLSSLLATSDEIWVLASEHHSNIVPWQFLCQRTGAKLRPIDLDEKGMIDWEKFKKNLSKKVKIIACQHISNVFGNIHNVKKLIQLGHSIGAVVLIDGAQSCSHYLIDVQDLDADFFVSSGHKMYAPTGIGFLYGKEKWLEKLPPYQGGGEMVKEVDFNCTTFAELPYKFEAGTPNICGAIALASAIDYINELGIEFIAQHEHQLLNYATKKLLEIDEITIYGTDDFSQKSGVISFNLNKIHSYDIGQILDKMGIALRTGHHCAQPVIDYYGLSGTARVSFAIYNTFQEIDFLVQALKKAQKMLL